MVAMQPQSRPRRNDESGPGHHSPKGKGALGHRSPRGEGGFTLVEFLVSSFVMTLVLSSAVALAMQIQESYQSDLDGEVVEQEARYALDWITRDLRSAGSNPYGAAGAFLVMDPNGGANTRDSIRVQADINPPDGDVLDPGEDITIAIAPDGASFVITRQDPNAVDPAALAMTEAIFTATGLQFTYLNASRLPLDPLVPINAGIVAYIQVQVSAQSRMRNAFGQLTTSTLSTEVRLRTR
jgi:hypothetical protein